MDRRRQTTLFVAAGVAIAITGYVIGHPPRQRAAVLDAVPRDAWLVVTIDVASIRASPIARPLFAVLGATRAIPGVASLADACGFDPLERVGDVLVASPEQGEHGDFGVAFTADVSRDDLAQCAEKVMRARGGGPVAAIHGSYTTFEDSSGAEPVHARLAYRAAGPFLVGRGPWLDAMMDAVDGRGDRGASEHAALRRAVVGEHGGRGPAVVVTARLPRALRDRLRGELGAELGGEADKAYAGVLAVSEAGIALRTGAEGSTTELTAELRCEEVAACDAVAKLIARKKAALAREIGVRLLGLGPLLDSLHVGASGTTLSAIASAPTDDLARAVERVLDLRGIAAPPASGAPATSTR